VSAIWVGLRSQNQPASGEIAHVRPDRPNLLLQWWLYLPSLLNGFNIFLLAWLMVQLLERLRGR
jgi:hypothetical protein